MAKQYRVSVIQNGKALCDVDITTPWADESLSKVLALFNDSSEYETKTFVAEDARQIYESSPEGIRVIASDPIFVPVNS